MKKEVLMNNGIRADKVFLVTEGEQPQVISYAHAMSQAEEKGLDLVKIAEQTDGTPICKIMDYNKFLYQENKRKQKQDKNNKPVATKVLVFRPGIGESDFNLKIKHANEFLEKNHKVKIVLKFKNRESTLQDFNQTVIDRIKNALEEKGELDSNVFYSFREANFLIKPKH